VGFYKANGYTELERSIVMMDGIGIDVVKMEKNLRQ
jgi:hypothetical protein